MSKVNVKYVSNSIIRILKLSIVKKINAIELKVHLMHWKQVPLLHNTVLISCSEGIRLVGINIDATS